MNEKDIQQENPIKTPGGLLAYADANTSLGPNMLRGAAAAWEADRKRLDAAEKENSRLRDILPVERPHPLDTIFVLRKRLEAVVRWAKALHLDQPSRGFSGINEIHVQASDEVWDAWLAALAAGEET